MYYRGDTSTSIVSFVWFGFCRGYSATVGKERKIK